MCSNKQRFHDEPIINKEEAKPKRHEEVDRKNEPIKIIIRNGTVVIAYKKLASKWENEVTLWCNMT